MFLFPLNLGVKRAIIFLEQFKTTFQHLSSPTASAKLRPNRGSLKKLGTSVNHVNSNPGFAQMCPPLWILCAERFIDSLKALVRIK